MRSRPACPKTFHACPRSASSDGFSIVDQTTGEETSFRTCAEARRAAEATYPGCVFALTTIGTLHKGAPSGTPDVVVMAILRRLVDEPTSGRFAVIAYVVASVEGPGCVPFAAAVWPDVKDHLPRDQRR